MPCLEETSSSELVSCHSSLDSIHPCVLYHQSFILLFSKQELRRAVEEFNNPPPQPEDPGRALDPGLEEDTDVFVELVDRMFYQLSCDGALVAIIADYPGLLPASHVSKTGVPTSKKDPLL